MVLTIDLRMTQAYTPEGHDPEIGDETELGMPDEQSEDDPKCPPVSDVLRSRTESLE